jgi:hypothetical protein
MSNYDSYKREIQNDLANGRSPKNVSNWDTDSRNAYLKALEDAKRDQQKR